MSNNQIDQVSFNGVEFKVGDYITAYVSGYHQISRIEKRFVTETLQRCGYNDKKVGDECNPLIYYNPIVYDKKKRCWRLSTREYSCDISYCDHASIKIEEEIVKNLDRNKSLDELKKLIKSEKICLTPDVNYRTEIFPSVISISASLPFDLTLSESEAEELEKEMHDAIERILSKFF